MSSHHTISLNLSIKNELSELEYGILNYVVNGRGSSPSSWPAHSYFSTRIKVESLINMYRDFVADGQFVSRFWCNDRLASGRVNGVTLLLPSITSPYNWEMLAFIDWMASLSDANGFVGAMVDDLPSQTITLLSVFEKKLFIGNAKNIEVGAYSTNEKRTVGY
ncbi:MAG: hypothetical protein O9327_10420 [Polaromonas sp.]|nr:hypothetical protein [Polaromonas sp.]